MDCLLCSLLLSTQILEANIFVPMYHVGKMNLERFHNWHKFTQLRKVGQGFSPRGPEWRVGVINHESIQIFT